jgi:hypothetical protein
LSAIVRTARLVPLLLICGITILIIQIAAYRKQRSHADKSQIICVIVDQ